MRLRNRSLMGMAVLLVFAGAMAVAQNNNVFTCSSDDGQLHSCRVNTDQPIQFVRQRSSAQCIQGETYGIDRGGVWVTNGCRADFAVVNNDQVYNQGTYNNDGYYNQGTYDNDHDRDRHDDNDAYNRRHEQWHRRHDPNNGAYRQNGPYRNGPYNEGSYGNGTYSPQGTYQGPYNNGGYIGESQSHPTVYQGKYRNGRSTCSADPGNGPTYCQTDGALSDATIVRQNGNCRRGQNWDINQDGLWVADGCSAEFQIQR